MAKKTVMEKNQEILLQKNEGAKLAHAVNQMHKILSLACRGGKEDIAQNASLFLTWLFFGDEYDDILNNEYRQELLKEPKLKLVVDKINQYADQSIKFSEMGRQYQKTGEEAIMSQIGKFSQDRGIFTEKALVDIMEYFIDKNIPELPPENRIRQTGTDQMTTWVSKWCMDILNDGTKEYEKIVNSLVKQNRKLRFAYKDVKIDTAAENPKSHLIFSLEDPMIDYYLNCVYQVLSSATIKSKNKLDKIDLEEVTILKVYSAFINYSKGKNITQSEIKNLLVKYYKTEELQSDPYITAHLNHIISVYALTGLGTSLQSDLKNILDGAKYLIAVDNLNKKVVIHSTNKIINEILLKNNQTKTLISNVSLNLNRL